MDAVKKKKESNGHQSGKEAGNQDTEGKKTFVAARVRYVMGRVCRKSRENTCP
jgi:hypothetical protein